MKISKFFLPALSLGASLLLPQLCAQTVAWGTTWSNLPLSFDSSGNVDTGANALTWELGYFDAGYTPDQTNWSSWADKWNGVATSSQTKNSLDIWKVAANSQVLEPVAVGKQVYVFVHNGMEKIGTPAGEVLMYRENGLAFPSIPNQITFDIADNPLDSNDDNFTVIWGQVDRNLYSDALWPTGEANAPANGGVLVGGGYRSNPLPDSQATPYNNNGTNEAQSATWIPEPASAMLVALGGALFALRRRRDA